MLIPDEGSGLMLRLVLQVRSSVIRFLQYISGRPLEKLQDDMRYRSRMVLITEVFYTEY